jgi:hypothetical protein
MTIESKHLMKVQSQFRFCVNPVFIILDVFQRKFYKSPVVFVLCVCLKY